MEYALQTKGISKYFAGNLAVDNVSIGVKRGEIYGFVGKNGAGKTTFMRMVCGLARPTGGSMKLFGNSDLVSQRYKVGCTIENPALYPGMTAMENMEIQRLLLGIQDKKVCSELLEMAGINNTAKKKAKDFSLGMKQRLIIAMSLLGNPEFLVLDEPTNGLDPMGIKEVRDFIQRLNESRGITILISTHILGDLEKMATCYGVISNGKMVDEFPASELSKRCGRNLVIHTSNPQKAENVIRDMFCNVKCTRTPENYIHINGYTEEAGNINSRLVREGVAVNALIPEGDKLEDYFLQLMGGRVHD